MVRQILARSSAAPPAGYCAVAVAVGHPCLGPRSYPIEVIDRASLYSPGFRNAILNLVRFPTWQPADSRANSVCQGALRLLGLLRRPPEVIAHPGAGFVSSHWYPWRPSAE
jgi:hypothetical protein